MISPSEVFGNPEEVVLAPQLSSGLKKRILQKWRYDVETILIDRAEGGTPLSETPPNLADIDAALKALESWGDREPTLT